MKSLLGAIVLLAFGVLCLADPPASLPTRGGNKIHFTPMQGRLAGAACVAGGIVSLYLFTRRRR